MLACSHRQDHFHQHTQILISKVSDPAVPTKAKLLQALPFALGNSEEQPQRAISIETHFVTGPPSESHMHSAGVLFKLRR